METGNVRIQHFRNRSPLGNYDPKGGFTIAYTYNADRHGNGKGDSTMELSIALCSPRDCFNKSIGRSLAIGSFEKGDTILFPIKDRDLRATLDILGMLVNDSVLESADTDEFHAHVASVVR